MVVAWEGCGIMRRACGRRGFSWVDRMVVMVGGWWFTMVVRWVLLAAVQAGL